MAIPNESTFEKYIVDGQLDINENLVTHPVFIKLLSYLQLKQISFSSASVKPKEEDITDVFVVGKNQIFSTPLTHAYFCIYEDAGSEQLYEFEWSGVLNDVSLDFLIKNKILKNNSFQLLDKIITEKFTEVDFLFTSKDQAFSFEARNPQLVIELPQLGISLKEINFFYEHSLNPQHGNTFTIYSKIQFGSTEFKTELKIPAGNNYDKPYWSLINVGPVILNNSLNDFISFLSGQDLIKSVLGDNILNILPSTVSNIPSFALSSLEINFEPKTGSLDLLDISLQSNSEFKICEGFSIIDVGFNAFLSINNSDVACSINLFGGFMFNNSIEACINITLPFDPKEHWIITIEGSVDLGSLKDLEAFSFLSLKDLNIPKEWFTIGSIRLHQFKLIFDPTSLKLVSLNLAIALNAQSPLIPGIKIKDPYLEFNLTF